MILIFHYVAVDIVKEETKLNLDLVLHMVIFFQSGVGRDWNAFFQFWHYIEALYWLTTHDIASLTKKASSTPRHCHRFCFILKSYLSSMQEDLFVIKALSYVLTNNN
jgi:hypothetical protein